MNDWRPHKKQETFLERGEFEVLYGGAAGGGKSDALLAAALYDIQYPKYHGLILRRTFPQLQELIDRARDMYGREGGTYMATKHRFEWPHGAKITFAHMQHEADKENFQGKEFHFVGFDELTHFTDTQYLYLISRIRRSTEGLGLVIRATTNPGSVGHVWVKKRFIDVADPMTTYIDPVTGTSRIFIPATVYDNPSIMDNDPLYIKRLESLPEIEKRRLLHGEWDVFEGKAFPELSDRIHGCDEFKIPPEWEKFMVFDWGYSRPFCCLWFAVDYDETLYLYRELYGMRDNNPDQGLRLTNSQICRAIFDAENEHIKYRIADPACWGPTKLKGRNDLLGPSFVEDAARGGLFFVKADNDRIRGKQQCHMRLSMNQDIDEQTGEILSEKPRLIIFRSCKRFWEEMQDLQEDNRNPEDVWTDQPDDGYDCFRYACMARPVAPKIRNIIPPGSFQAERARLIKAKKFALRHGCTLTEAYSRVR